MDTSHVLNNIRAEMARRIINQADLAQALGVTQQSVSRKLTGRTDLSVRELLVIADYLAVSPETLIAP